MVKLTRPNAIVRYPDIGDLIVVQLSATSPIIVARVVEVGSPNVVAWGDVVMRIPHMSGLLIRRSELHPAAFELAERVFDSVQAVREAFTPYRIGAAS